MTIYTIAGLRAFTGTPESVVCISDAGKAGLFRHVALDTSTDDTGVVLLTLDGSRYKRIYEGPVNLAWFGLLDNPLNAQGNPINQLPVFKTVLEANRYGWYFIPKGLYWLQPADNPLSVEIPSNIRITAHEQAVIRQLVCPATSFSTFRIANKTNVIIEGGEWIGERDAPHTAGGEAGMIFRIMTSSNITIRNMKMSYAWTDSIYVGGDRQIYPTPIHPVTGTFTVTTIAEQLVTVTGDGSVSMSYMNGPTLTQLGVFKAISSRWIVFPLGTPITVTILTGPTDGVVTSLNVDRPCENITIENVDMSHCGRNGMSISSCAGFKILNCRASFNDRTLPMAGIDVEPLNGERAINGLIQNFVSFKNGMDGIVCSGRNVIIDSCLCYDNPNNGIWLTRGPINADGESYPGGNIKVNGGMILNSGDVGINVGSLTDFDISNVSIDGVTAGEGIAIGFGENLKVSGCTIKNTANEGLTINNGKNYLFQGNVVDRAALTNAAGIQGRTGDGLIADNIVTNCGLDGIKVHTAGFNVTVANNFVAGSGRNGILIDGPDSIVTGNRVTNNNSSNGSTYNNITINSSNNLVMGNRARKGTNNPRYGIKVNATFSGNKLIDNDVEGGGSLGTISDAGTDTVYSLSLVGRKSVANIAYSQIANDEYIAYTSLTAARSITLLAASQWAGKTLTIKDEAGKAGMFNITVVGTIEGATNKIINTNYGSVKLYSNGTSIFIL
jgi:hypothetical protein